MKTLNENTREVGSSAYWGERGHWFLAAAQTRDSDCLARSNFRCFTAELKSIDENSYAIESFNHWAVGWVEYLLVNPECKKAVELAESLRTRLEDYPILDEHDFSELESDEANEVWKNCFREKERIEYIRTHRSQFDFRNFQDILGCARGNYFAGYASELLN